MRWKGKSILDDRDLDRIREREVFALLPLYDPSSNTYYWLERVVVVERLVKSVENYDWDNPLPSFEWWTIEIKPVKP